jgi:hypothetical protein
MRITYVTESPSCKPGYRLELGKDTSARLEAWAVVHNVSGEDWKDVTVGVGSTSALSFKYDLRSVHLVERETLSDESKLGVAPPTGGSPYEVASNEVQVLGAVPIADLGGDRQAPKLKVLASREESQAGGALSATAAAPTSPPAPVDGEKRFDALARRARASQQRIRIEGFARPGDADQRGASLENANKVRDSLVKNGVPLDKIDVVATGKTSSAEAARVIAVAPGSVAPSQPSAKDDEPLGDAYFVAPAPLDVEKGHSAMVNVLTTQTRAEPVYFYDPISARGSKRFAFRAVLLDNPSQHTLDPGPVTVYAEGQFLGEGLSDAIPPKSRAFIPFSLDRKLVVETKEDGREEIDRLVTVQRGVLTTEARRVESTEITLVNRGAETVVVYVRHAPAPGTELARPEQGFEKLRGAYLFPVQVPAGGSSKLVIEEASPIRKTVDIRNAAGIGELRMYLKTAKKLDPSTRARLDQIVSMHRAMAELEERIQTAQNQSQTYRERINELNVQLVTLRKVPQAQGLSRNLAQKMDEISQKLQKLTLQIADLEGQVLAERVALEDRLAELTLDKPDAAVAARP